MNLLWPQGKSNFLHDRRYTLLNTKFMKSECDNGIPKRDGHAHAYVWPRIEPEFSCLTVISSVLKMEVCWEHFIDVTVASV